MPRKWYPFNMIKIKDGLGLTTYWVYGGGNGHYNTSSTDKFKLHRAFVGNDVVTQGNLDLRVEPTEQNFKYDTYLKQLVDLGIKPIWCTQGKFDFQNTVGKIGKVMPINEEDSPLDQSSWATVGELCRQVAIRYAPDTAQHLDKAKVFTGVPGVFPHLWNVPKAGLNLIDAIEIQNEWDFKQGWSGATRTITPEEYAVCFKVCYDAIRSVSPTIKIIMGGGISPIMSTFTRFLGKLDEMYAAEGKTTPKDFYLCFHWYMRNGSSDQGGGTTGITPEDAKAYEFGQSLDALCEQRGLPGWYCTETGWATDSSKQQSPILEGFTKEQSQGILMTRLMLIWGACKRFQGVSFWHCRDDYDLPPYAKGGVNYKNWSAKPARTICEEFIAKYGDKEVLQFKQIGDKYFAYLSGGIILSWTNLLGSPMPLEVIEVPEPPQDMSKLTIQNHRLCYDGVPFKIIEANSPEVRLHYLDTAELDYLHNVGMNTIYLTAFGGDDKTIHPFKDRANPSAGFDEVKLAAWKQYAEHWVSLGGIKVLHILLSEKENHYELSDAMHFALIDKLVETFGHLPVIWDREELDNGKAAYIDKFYGYLKTKHPQGIRGMHNNTSQNPWSAHYSSDLVQFLSFQENVASFDSRIKTEVAKNPGWAGYASEMTGGFTPTDTTKVDTICAAGGELSSGAGFYIASKDLVQPGFQQQYEAIYKRAVANFGGIVTPPPSTTMEIFLSTKADRSDAVKLNNAAVFVAAQYYVEAKGVTPTVFFTLKKDGVVIPSINNKAENGAPFDMTGGPAYNFSQGAYELTVKDKTAQNVYMFNMGTLTPPPTPTSSPVKKIDLLEDGKVQFTADDGRVKVLG